MNSFSVFVVFALAAVAMVVAEAPSGYNYQRNGGGHGGSFSSSSSFSSGGGFQAVSGGFQTSEGQNVDAQLLEQVRQILLNEESKNGGNSGSTPSGSYGPPSGSYGPPSNTYGVPGGHNGGRVVGIDLEGVRQAIQVAQFHQQTSESSGYPSGPSGSYGAPPSRPNTNYGTPY